MEWLASRRQWRNGPLAQSAEHRTFNPGVVGSTPTRPTKNARTPNPSGGGIADCGVEKTPMAGKSPRRSRKSTSESASERASGAVALLSGGNPQIAKADGNAPVQAYIAAMPEWKGDVGRQLDELIVRTVPNVRKAVRWNSPFYGVEGQGMVPELPRIRPLREGDLPQWLVARPSAPGRVQGQGYALLPHFRGRNSRRGTRRELDPASGRHPRLGRIPKRVHDLSPLPSGEG